MRNRFLSTVIAAILAGGAAMAAPPVAPPSQSVLHLLQDADDAATRGDRIGAVQRYHSAMVFAPSYPDAYNRLAQFYLADDQPDMARKYFAIALDVDLVNPSALKGLAILSLAAGDFASAQARHEVLLRACGQGCPETAHVGQALSAALAASASGESN